MKILFVIGSLARGGAETHLTQLLPALKKFDFEPHLFLIGDDLTLIDHFKKNQINVYYPKAYSFLLSFPKPIRVGLITVMTLLRLIVVIWKLRPRIINSFLPAAYIITQTVCWFWAGSITVMSRRSLNHYQKKRPAVAFYERQLHKKLDAAIANSNAVLSDLMNENIPAHKITLIHNGVHLNRLDKQKITNVRQKLNIDEHTFVIIKVANLIKYKGHVALIRALGQIADKLDRNWRLLLVGRDDGELFNIAKEVETLDLQQNVEFLGEVADVGQYIAVSDVGIICSREEGFSNALLEKMAKGLPIIATRVGGNTDAVTHGKNGFLTEPDNIDEIAKYLLRYYRSPALRKNHGNSCRDLVNRKFSVENMIKNYVNFYNEVEKTDTKR